MEKARVKRKKICKIKNFFLFGGYFFRAIDKGGEKSYT